MRPELTYVQNTFSILSENIGKIANSSGSLLLLDNATFTMSAQQLNENLWKCACVKYLKFSAHSLA